MLRNRAEHRKGHWRDIGASQRDVLNAQQIFAYLLCWDMERYTYTGLPWACDMKAEDANGAKGSFAASPGYMHNTLLKHPSTQP